jgi:hypothetical protein
MGRQRRWGGGVLVGERVVVVAEGGVEVVQNRERDLHMQIFFCSVVLVRWFLFFFLSAFVRRVGVLGSAR